MHGGRTLVLAPNLRRHSHDVTLSLKDPLVIFSSHACTCFIKATGCHQHGLVVIEAFADIFLSRCLDKISGASESLNSNAFIALGVDRYHLVSCTTSNTPVCVCKNDRMVRVHHRVVTQGTYNSLWERFAQKVCSIFFVRTLWTECS